MKIMHLSYRRRIEKPNDRRSMEKSSPQLMTENITFICEKKKNKNKNRMQRNDSRPSI